MNYKMKLHPKYFDKVKDGSKTIECRLFDEKRRELKIGDIIEFTNSLTPQETITTKIIGLLNYQSFNDLISDFPAVYFGTDNKQELLNDLGNFYSHDQEKEFSVIGIRVRLTLTA